MFVYAIVGWTKVHNDCCKGFNSQYEKVRTHIKGVYLSKEAAQKVADGLNKNSRKENNVWVKGYKVRDAQDVVEYADAI